MCGIIGCEARAILDTACEKHTACVFAIISRNGALAQQPRIGRHRLH